MCVLQSDPAIEKKQTLNTSTITIYNTEVHSSSNHDQNVSPNIMPNILRVSTPESTICSCLTTNTLDRPASTTVLSKIEKC